MPNLNEMRRQAARGKALKSLTFSEYGMNRYGFGTWGTYGGAFHGSPSRSRPNYKLEVGELYTNATCMACIHWMQTTLTEAPPVVLEMDSEGEENEVPNHALVELLKKPNPQYSGKSLLKRTILSFMSGGNAYWYKVKAGDSDNGPVRELWEIPYHRIRIIPDRRKYISHYETWVDGKKVDETPPESMVHFRYGVDPKFEQSGYTPWNSIRPLISMDNQGSEFHDSLFRNSGAMAGIFTPKNPDVILEPSDLASIQARLDTLTTGTNVGKMHALGGAMDYLKTAMSPEEMNALDMWAFAQDIICAVVNLSTLLLNLPSGSKTRTFSNLEEARQAAYESNVIPTLDTFAAEINLQLLPDFDTAPNRALEFETKDIRVLQPDKQKEYAMFTQAVGGPWITSNEARAVQGMTEIEGGDKLYPKTGGALGGGAGSGNPNDPQVNDPNADPNAQQDVNTNGKMKSFFTALEDTLEEWAMKATSKKPSGSGGHWVTINGAHVFIGGSGGGSGESSSSSSDEVGDKWGRESFQAWGEQLSGTERTALVSYKKEAYRPINRSLRFPGKFSDEKNAEIKKEYIDPLDSALGKATINQDIHVYRNFELEPFEKAKPEQLIGRSFYDKGFYSTSLSKTAMDDMGGIRATVKVPKGTKGAYIEHVASLSKNEYEVLLPRNTKFKITNVKDIKGVRHMTLEVIHE